MEAKFYVYAYLREDGTPYYIGKGKDKRAWSKQHSVSLPKDMSRIVLMEKNLTEIGAFALERRYIKWYGRKDNGGILYNFSDGGEGHIGRKITEETRKRMSEAQRGLRKNLSDEQRKLRSEIAKRLKHTEEFKKKMSLRLSGSNNPNYGKTFNFSEMHRKSLSEASKNVKRINCSHCSKDFTPWGFVKHTKGVSSWPQ
jgi:hypothetical protein